MSPVTYSCPISLSPPRVPVSTNEGITYDFLFLARSLLREENRDNPYFNPQLDPITRGLINTLIYNYTIKQLNDQLMEDVAPLTDEEKDAIDSFYIKLCVRYPTLKIYGLSKLDGMQIIDQRELYFAAQRGLVDDVCQLLAKPQVNLNQAMSDGATPFSIAVYKGHTDIVNVLLADNRLDPNRASNDGVTPLYIAAKNGHLGVVNALLFDNRIYP